MLFQCMNQNSQIPQGAMCVGVYAFGFLLWSIWDRVIKAQVEEKFPQTKFFVVSRYATKFLHNFMVSKMFASSGQEQIGCGNRRQCGHEGSPTEC